MSTEPSEKTVLIEIIPKGAGDFDFYHRLPSQIGLTGTATNGEGNLQFEYSGSGPLDEKGERSVNFLFRGPDSQDVNRYGRRDEYRLSYHETPLDLHIGDRDYSLSPLTERYSYGRGAEINISPKPFGFGAFFFRDRWRTPKERVLGTNLEYRRDGAFSVKANFLNRSGGSEFRARDRTGIIYSIQSEIRPSKEVNLDLEYGFSNSDQEGNTNDRAYRIGLYGQVFNDLRYDFEKIHAGPKYFGAYHDVEYTLGTVAFPIYHKLRGNVSYRNYKNNLDLDLTTTAPKNEESYRTDLSYFLPFGTSISIAFQNLQKEDLLSSTGDFTEKTLRFSLRQTLHQRLSLYTSVEKGTSKNSLNTQREDVDRYYFSAYFQPSYSQTYTLYTRIEDNRFIDRKKGAKSIGGSATWRFKAMDFKLGYVNNNYDSDESPKQHDIFSTVAYSLPNHHSLHLKAYWSKREESKEESSVFFTYMIPWKVPVSRKKSASIFKGKVYYAESPGVSPIPKVILRMNGATAVTNQKGEFIFAGLKPGIYPLQVNRNTIGLDRITLEKLPKMIKLEAGKTTELELGVVTACRISGRVAIFDYSRDNDSNPDEGGSVSSDSPVFLMGTDESRRGNSSGKDNLREAKGLGNVLVEIANGKETLRELAHESRGFSFEGIRPGKWTLRNCK